jgi:hypothetical protein
MVLKRKHLPNPKPKTLNAFLLHLKAFSPLRKKKSLSHTLSLSLFTKKRREKSVFFIVESCRHRESNIEKFKRAKRENWNWKLPARGNISVRAKALEEEEEKRGGCREETNNNNNTKTTDRC